MRHANCLCSLSVVAYGGHCHLLLQQERSNQLRIANEQQNTKHGYKYIVKSRLKEKEMINVTVPAPTPYYFLYIS